MVESEFKPDFDRQESPEEAEKTIKSVEVAQEMANAEIEPRERLGVAVQLGLNEKSINELGLEIDEASNKTRENYEKAMQEADSLLTQLIRNPNESVIYHFRKTGFADDDGSSLLNAINYRIRTCDKQGSLTSKHFVIGGREKRISALLGETLVLKFENVED